MMYRQCELRKGDLVDVRWVPSQFGVVGKLLTLADDPGWQVTQAYSEADESVVLDKITDYRNGLPSTIGQRKPQ